MDGTSWLLIEDDQLFIKIIEQHLKSIAKEVHYIVIKPFKSKEEIEYKGKVIDIVQKNLQIAITQILHKLGVPSHINGYHYLKEGIKLIYQSEESLILIKKIYPFIAKKYHSTVSKVERSIRHAIEVSWNRGDWDLMEELFGNSIDGEKAKPTNSEYIITIAEKLKLDFYQ